MKVIVISASPNKVGLTNDCVDICAKALNDQEQEVEIICLNNYNIKRCEACGPRGWGTCLEQSKCRMDDEFQLLQEKINGYDGIILISPVYFHEMSEVAKTFFDRFKRCEAFNENASLIGKPMLCIATAGGSGSGTENCLNSMNLLAKFLKMKVVENIGITKFNFEDKKDNIVESTLKLIKKGLSKQN
ncbi:MAG: flavodoxin family protein [Deltaproteobacteria bacterium]